MNATSIPCLTSVRRTLPVRHRAPAGFALIAVLLTLPISAQAECTTKVSPVPVAGAASGGATPVRAAMFRVSAVPSPAIVSSRLERARTSARKPDAAPRHRGKVGVQRSKGPKRKASAQHARRRAPVMSAAKPIAAPLPASGLPAAALPAPSAASYVLIHTTICETGPTTALAIPLPEASPPTPATYDLAEPSARVASVDLPLPTDGILLIAPTLPGSPTTIAPVTPVPEPGAWTLLISGFAATGVALRARRARSQAGGQGV
ncbi:MAG: hypothetical protein DI570_17305 [Phenylobacterium zucineum]|nr:MAG: hypothetical protein DI570_17305 [Phenylobacterium zucineum]